MVEIIPAILTEDTNEFFELFNKAEGKVGRIQIDVIDGKFADNKTVGPEILADSDTKMNIDYHLMVADPISWVDRCPIKNETRIIAHIEHMDNSGEFVAKAKEHGAEAGLAIDLDTEVSTLDESILPEVSVILTMSVKAGFGGQEFSQLVLDKIDALDKMRKEKGYTYRICDDGGLTYTFIDDIRREGADEASIGNRIFKGDLVENIKSYTQAAEKDE